MRGNLIFTFKKSIKQQRNQIKKLFFILKLLQIVFFPLLSNYS
jgi:hypothetical protein